MSFEEELTITIIDKLLIGALLAIAGYYFSKALETYRAAQAKKDDISRNVRLALAELAKSIASGLHSISWLCWAAKHSPTEVAEKLNGYDKEMHVQLDNLTGSRVALAALDNKMHLTLSPIIDQLYSLDVEVGHAKALYITSAEEGLKALGKLHIPANDLNDKLLAAVINIVS